MFSTRVRVAQLGELALYLLLLSFAWGGPWNPWLALAFVAAIALAVRLALVLATFGLAWIHRSRRAPERRIGPLRTARMLLREWRALLVFNLLYVPWDRFFLGREPQPREGVAVVLVHGYLANRGYWRPFVRRLGRAGVEQVFAPNLRSWLAGIDRFEQELGEAVERIAAATGRPVVLVAHSMGGLGARAFMARRGSGAVARLVTLGTPHHGTALAPFGVGDNARQMRRGSAWLAALERGEGAGPPIPALSIFSWHDNMVAPQETSRLAWAREESVPGVGHLDLVVDEAVFGLVLRELRAAGAVPD